MRNPKIMIVYASYGEGHYQVSKAMEASFHERGITNVVLLDLMAEAHPLINELTKFVYMQSFKTIPYLYGWVYNSTRRMQPGRPLYSLLHSFGLRKLAKIVADINPDLVIHTFPQLVMPKLLRRTGQTIPLANVITDFDIHGRWVHPSVNRYYVATQDLKNEMVARGVPEERVMVSGIPLRPGFAAAAAVQAKAGDLTGRPDSDPGSRPDPGSNQGPAYSLPQDGKPAILLMAGAYGVMQNIADICRRLTASGERRVIAVCGKNKELLAQLQEQFKGHRDVQVCGFVQNIAELMAASDCIITKPGGITLSEALASRLPMFLFRPVPGQELNNALYLNKKGIAFISNRPRELVRQIEQFFSSRQPGGELYQELDSLRRPDAANEIAEDLLRLFIWPAEEAGRVTAAGPY